MGSLMHGTAPLSCKCVGPCVCSRPCARCVNPCMFNTPGAWYVPVHACRTSIETIRNHKIGYTTRSHVSMYGQRQTMSQIAMPRLANLLSTCTPHTHINTRAQSWTRKQKAPQSTYPVAHLQTRGNPHGAKGVAYASGQTAWFAAQQTLMLQGEREAWVQGAYPEPALEGPQTRQPLPLGCETVYKQSEKCRLLQVAKQRQYDQHISTARKEG